MAVLSIVVAADNRREGIWFTKKGDVTLSGEKWRVVININVTEICGGIEELRLITNNTKDQLTKAAQDFSELRPYKGSLQRIVAMGGELADSAESLLNLLPHHRHVRGLLNLRGKVLRLGPRRTRS